MNIELDDGLVWGGGYMRLKGGSPFADEVNKRLGEYWVSTGAEKNIQTTMLEVLAEDYNSRHLTPSQETNI